MKWFVFTAACVIALVALGVLAVDERDVEWEGRTPRCGYCRSELAPLAVVCPHCDRSLDWRPHAESCQWCLSDKDIDYLNDVFESLDPEEEPLPGELAPFPRVYFLTIAEGTCTYCGGVGTVLETGAKITCPVCRGGKTCVACDGDRVVVIGDAGAYQRARERDDEKRRARVRARVTDRTLREGMLLDEDVEALRGYLEAESLTDAQDRNLLGRARAQLERAFKALHTEDALRRRRAPDEGSG